MAYAYCHRTGEIGLCETPEQLPSHTIVFDQHKSLDDLRIRTIGRAGHDPHTGIIFVPGVYGETNHAHARNELAKWLACNDLSNRWFFADDLKSMSTQQVGVAS
jgi:hypothetical protein